MQPTLNKEHILQLLSDNRRRLRDFGVEQIGLFGSFVKNEATKESDIDLLVNIQKDKKTFRNFLALNYYEYLIKVISYRF